MYDEKNPSIILCSRDLEEALNMKALHVTEIRYDESRLKLQLAGTLYNDCTNVLHARDLVLSHLIKLESDEFLKRHCDSVTPAPAPNNVSSNQNPGMLASQPRTSRRIIQRDNLRRYPRLRARDHT